MLRQTCFYKRDIETRKKTKSKEKNLIKVCNLIKTKKAKFSAENPYI